jgi:hypothetical protein
MYGGVARGAAAAAIVCLVAGGGWRIYSHVQPASGAGVIAMPAGGTPSGGGFSIGGAKRRPDTVVGPVLTHPVAPVPEANVVEKTPAQPNHVQKPKAKKSPRRPLAAPVP